MSRKNLNSNPGTTPVPIGPLPAIINAELEQIAFTHRSALNEYPTRTVSNERMEFLGDAVLELVVSRHLYDQFPDEPEGVLTSYRSSLVKTTTLAIVSKEYGLGEKLIMSKGEELSGGHENEALLANTMEAFIGALYLDQGYEAAQAFIESALLPKLEEIRENNMVKDPKSTLQEYAQSKHQRPPSYKVVGETGPDHQKQFIVSVSISGQKLGEATGRNKQEAQQLAAAEALEKITQS